MMEGIRDTDSSHARRQHVSVLPSEPMMVSSRSTSMARGSFTVVPRVSIDSSVVVSNGLSMFGCPGSDRQGDVNLEAGSFHGFNRRCEPKARARIQLSSSSLRQSQMEEFSGWLEAHRLIEGACPAGGHGNLSRVSASGASDDRIHQACSDSASASRFDHIKFQYLSDQAVCIECGYIDCVYVAQDIVVVFCNQEVGHWRIDGYRIIAIEVRARGLVARCEEGEQPEYCFDVGCGGLTDWNPRNTLVTSSHFVPLRARWAKRSCLPLLLQDYGVPVLRWPQLPAAIGREGPE